MPTYPNKNQPIQYINDIAYLIQATFPINQVKDVVLIKEWLGSDIAFQNQRQGIFLFGKIIEAVEFEEIK